MKTIKLTRGYETIVDDEDFEELSKYKWHAHGKDRYIYAARSEVQGGRIVRFLMHKELLSSGRLMVDHKNGNTLDNRRENLRKATRGLNRANSTLRKNKLSSYRGVCPIGPSWRAQIAGAVIGSLFKSEVAAALAYDWEARQRFGGFARLNFPYGGG